MRRLGLDIGTNSIGWCLIEDDSRIVDLGSRIFSDGRVPNSGESLAVKRRIARGARRRRDRYLGRRAAFLDSLMRYGLMPDNSDEAKLIAELDPYPLRARALDEKLEPYEIGRVLFHLNQRRGFKSNRKAERKEGKADGKIASGAKALDKAIKECGARTLGEFLNGQNSKRIRIDGENKDYDFYPQRHHILAEFEAIWTAQKANHPELLNKTAYAALWRIIEFQRGLKPQDVGKCTFAGRNGVPCDERRLPKAHPLFQERRLYEEVNKLQIMSPGEQSRPLKKDERDKLILKLKATNKPSYKTLGALIKLDPDQSFNMETENRTHLLGDGVYIEMSKKAIFGNKWKLFDDEQRWAIIEKLLNEENPESLHEYLRKEHGLDNNQIAAVEKSAFRLPDGYGRIGETATKAILQELKADVVPYSKAVERAGWHHSSGGEGGCHHVLPYYGEALDGHISPGSGEQQDLDNYFSGKDPSGVEKYWGKITNPTVHIGLRQVEKLVNAIIRAYGRPDEIVVELARELKLNEKQKNEQKKRIRDTTRAAEKRADKLRKEGIPDTGRNRMLLRIWEGMNPQNPLDRRCVYCGEPIGMHMLFSGETDIDHILPYKRTLDDSASNKVVAHRHCNRQKGDRTPWEVWGDTDRWGMITDQVSRLHKSKQWRFQPDAMKRFDEEGGFIQRQLTDTQYLSRMAGRYLSSLYASEEKGSVYVIPGRMTAMLRRLWGLNSLLPDHNFVENEHSNAPKNRLDHRHHTIDAAVVAVTTRGLLNEISRAAGRAEHENLVRLFKDLPQPWEGFREELGEKVLKVTVSHKADHGRKGKPPRHRDETAAQLHNETAYGFTGEYAANGKTPIVVHRVAFSDLKPRDLLNPGRIPDEGLRSALYHVAEGVSDEKEFKKALVNFSKNGGRPDKNGNPIFKGIRRVRVREALSVIPIKDRQGKVYKGYKGDSNARYDVWRLPDGKWMEDAISTFDAHQPDQGDRRPHPAAKKMFSLRQNDMLAIEHEGNSGLVVRVVQFSKDGRILFAPHNEAGALKARNSALNEEDPFKYISLNANGLKSRKARQIVVDLLGRVLDPGPRK